MKKLLLILLCIPLMTLSQKTYVPDDKFEQELINLGYDNVLDNYVNTEVIDTVLNLKMRGKFIFDLTGIEDFTNLTLLACEGNQLTSLDVSQNTNLETLMCSRNQLTSLDVSQNPALTTLWCSNNQLTSLDVSQNTALDWLHCNYNQLTTLNVRNGNNSDFLDFIASRNPNLSCIIVDNVDWSIENWKHIDSQHDFRSECQ